jgi:RNA polymerase sigma-70 factor (ECF subfamily)
MTDMELIERIRKGDERAFESLFRSYYKTLCFFSYKIVKDSVVAEEIVQDIFYYIWEKHAALELNTSVKSYLFKSAHNNSLKYLRHQKIVAGYEDRVKASMEDTFDVQENYAEVGEIMHIISQTLDQVPERSREIFNLNRNEGLKYQEIADQLHVSIKTVEAHMTSVLKLFRENLKEYLLMVLFCIFVN